MPQEYPEEQLYRLCRRYGQRLDLVQGAGGNISVKDGNVMFIKSSGVALASVTEENGYSVLNYGCLNRDIKKGDYFPIERYCCGRASMETYMHSFLKKYVVHLHPIQVNCILCSKSSEVIIGNLFPNSCYIKYATPGVELSKEIYSKWRGQSLIFLENHGIIITTDTEEEIEPLLNEVLDRCEAFCQADFRLYRQVTLVSDIINKKFNSNLISYYFEGADSYSELDMNLFPDKVVFCKNILTIDEIEELKERLELFGIEPPNAVIVGGACYLIGKSLNHCRDMEDIIKAHILTRYLTPRGQRKELSAENVNDILNLDSEKYRKSLT